MAQVEFATNGDVLRYEADRFSVRGGSGRVYKLSDKFPYDPELLERTGLRTVKDVLKVWLDVRDYLGHLPRLVSNMVDYTCRDMSEVFSLKTPKGLNYWMTADLNDSALYVWNAEAYDRTSLQPLLSGRGTTGAREAHVLRCYGNKIKCVYATEDSSYPATKWNKLRNYTFKMDSDEFNFFRHLKGECKSSVMFGMELEVSTALDIRELQAIVTEVRPKQEPFFIFKQDSSISGRYSNKVELVTVPCTPKYLKKAWKLFFEKVERLCEERGLELKDVFDVSPTLTNGIHIHVSKDTFLDKLHKRKFVAAWNSTSSSSVVRMLSVVSGRSDYMNNAYCRPSYRYETPRVARLLLTDTDGRATCHELPRTIEVRLFQGIVDIKHILRCIETTEAMYYMSSVMPISKFHSYPDLFAEFVTKHPGYTNIKEFLECA